MQTGHGAVHEICLEDLPETDTVSRSVVTQEIDDLIGSPIIKEAIVGNSDIKILMDMRKFMNKFDTLQATLGMSEKGKTMLFSVNRANDRAAGTGSFTWSSAGR